MAKIFGTDGIRGLANDGNLSIDFFLKLVPAVLEGRSVKRVVIGNDTRISGSMIVNALSSIFNAYSVNVSLVGCVPTPSLSYITKQHSFDIGIMVTASHNPYQDNGIKFFNSYGQKFSIKDEEQIVGYLNKNSKRTTTHSEIGTTIYSKDSIQEYIKFITDTFDGLDLSDLRIVIDCANGAFSDLIKEALNVFSANVTYLSNTPNGININDNCGVIYPLGLSNEVRQNKADLGIAFDGDGDRVLICDENGDIVDGDHLIGFIAKYTDKIDRVAITETSNLAIDAFLSKLGVKVIRTAVGDKFISALVASGEATLGGEKSGHIIVNEKQPTGDGLLVALTVISLLKTTKKRASLVMRPFELAPSVSRNVLVNDKSVVESKAMKDKLASYANDDTIRVLVRASGTENVIRIIVEGKDSSKIKLVADELEEICKTNIKS